MVLMLIMQMDQMVMVMLVLMIVVMILIDLIFFGAHKEELVATLAPGCLHMRCLKWFDDESNFLNQYDVSCDFHS